MAQEDCSSTMLQILVCPALGACGRRKHLNFISKGRSSTSLNKLERGAEEDVAM